ncbi:unnamed protein product [Lampetra planeri]
METRSEPRTFSPDGDVEEQAATGQPTRADNDAAPPAEQSSITPADPPPASRAAMEETLLRLTELLHATVSILDDMRRSQAETGGRRRRSGRAIPPAPTQRWQPFPQQIHPGVSSLLPGEQ